MTQPLPDEQRTQPMVLAGRYELERLLGRGGMAEVHLGRDILLDRRVAVKLLSWGSDDDGRVQRLRREARAAASLDHPHVVAVHDIGLSPQAVFVVMEYLEGESLRELLAREGRLPADRAVAVTAQVCDALEAVHQRGVVHRDVTPANIMICPDGRAKVMDFGIARLGADASVTATGLVIGTPAYMSPEQVRSQAVDARSDVYSLGCCLFHQLAGRPPFVGSDPVALAYQHVKEPPPSPIDLRPDVAPELATVVLRAIAKRPEDRYQSAAELRAALQQDGAGTAQRTTQPLTPAGTLTLPSPRGDGPAGDEGDLSEPGLDEPDPDEARGRMRRRLGFIMIVAACAAILAVVALLLYQSVLGSS